MLLYEPPFLESGNLTIFRDDKDAEAFYYAVIQPSILTGPQGPSVSGYAILPETGLTETVDNVMDASLSLEVGLQVSEEQLELAKQHVKEQWGKKVKRFTPVPISDGKVYMIIAAAGEEPDPEEWYVTSGVSPSIFGNNRAALVAKASGEEGKRMIAALDGDVIAGQVYYELQMLGIAPTFHARMHVEWSRVYRHFEEFKSKNYVFYKDEISRTIDELEESSLIQMEIEELDPDVKDIASKSLLNELKTQVVNRLFQPAVPPLSASKNLESRIASGISRVLSSIIPGSHYIIRDLQEHQLSTTTIDLKERKVKKYPFYPQALLSTMIQQVGGMEGRLKWLKLDNLDFRTETVHVSLSADAFTVPNLRSVQLDCRVVDETHQKIEKEQMFVFDKAENLSGQFTYIRQSDANYHYEYHATLYLDNTSTILPPKLESGWQTSLQAFVYFNPSEYFENTELRIDLDDADIFNYAHLVEGTITVRERETQHVLLMHSFTWNATAHEKESFSLLLTQSIPVQFDLQLKYYLAGMKEYVIEFPDLQDINFFIPNPFENKWSVEMISMADWQTTEKIVAEIRVWEEARQDFLLDKFDFTADQPQQVFSTVTSLETPREELEMRLTVIKKDAIVLRGAWKKYLGPVLVVKDQVIQERTVQAMLVGAPDFQAKDIKKITIAFVYDDLINGIHIESDKLPFEQVGDKQTFTHPMPDFTAIEYQYRVEASNWRGDRYKTEWITAHQEALDIVLPETIW